MIDTKDVGFITDDRAKGAGTYTFDTSVKGNSNAGHEGPLFGTDLPDADKDAIVEYLKTR